MKKQLLIAGLALCGAMVANADAPTLTQEWTKSCPLGAASARSGVGTNGKFYLIEQNKGVHVFDQTGEVKTINNSSAWVSVNCDDAGHVYFRNDVGGWAGPAGDGSYLPANARFCVYDAVADEMVAENVPMSGGPESCRFDALPHVHGNMATSPFNIVAPAAWTRTFYDFAFQSLAAPTEVVYSTDPIAYYDQGSLTIPNSTTGITQMYDDNHLAAILNANSNETALTGKANTIGIFEKTANGKFTFKGYANTPNHSGVAGFHIFGYKDHQYIVYPTCQVGSQASVDGFAVMELEVVASPANTDAQPLVEHKSTDMGETYPRYFNVEPVPGNDGKFSIYLYSPGKSMSVYTLDLTPLFPAPEYTKWYVNIQGDYNGWNDNGLQPNEEGITLHKNLPLGTGGFKVKVYDGSDHWYGYNSGTIAVGEWVQLEDGSNMGNMTAAGANVDSRYDVEFNVVTNEIRLTEIVTKPDYTTWYVNVPGDYNGWADNGLHPDEEGICEHKDLALGSGEFKIKVYDGANHWFSTNSGAVAVGEWVTLNEGVNVNMTVAGANADSRYDVTFDVANNKIFLTDVTPVPDFTMSYTLNTVWRADMRETNASHMRQGIGVNGKMYITNCQYYAWDNNQPGWVEVWGENGFVEKIYADGGGDISGTNITCDEAGNILVRKSYFPNTFTGSNFEAIIIDPEGNQTPITFDARRFNNDMGCSNNRQDFWGHVKGNMLSDEGGCFTFGTSESGHTDIKIVNGVHVGGETSRDSYWADSDLPHTSTSVFHSYSWMTDEALYQSGPNGAFKYVKREPINGTFKWFVRGEYKAPDHNKTVGCALFRLDGENYIVYSRGGNNADGIIVAKARINTGSSVVARAAKDDPDVLIQTFAELDDNGATKYNGGQYNHFNVEVDADGETARIYQYCPGNFAAMHEFKATKVSTGVEDVIISEEAPEAIDAAPVYYNIQGVRVANPQSGLYIEVRGNKVRKVLIH